MQGRPRGLCGPGCGLCHPLISALAEPCFSPGAGFVARLFPEEDSASLFPILHAHISDPGQTPRPNPQSPRAAVLRGVMDPCPLSSSGQVRRKCHPRGERAPGQRLPPGGAQRSPAFPPPRQEPGPCQECPRSPQPGRPPGRAVPPCCLPGLCSSRPRRSAGLEHARRVSCGFGRLCRSSPGRNLPLAAKSQVPARGSEQPSGLGPARLPDGGPSPAPIALPGGGFLLPMSPCLSCSPARAPRWGRPISHPLTAPRKKVRPFFQGLAETSLPLGSPPGFLGPLGPPVPPVLSVSSTTAAPGGGGIQPQKSNLEMNYKHPSAE